MSNCASRNPWQPEPSDAEPRRRMHQLLNHVWLLSRDPVQSIPFTQDEQDALRVHLMAALAVIQKDGRPEAIRQTQALLARVAKG